ncbi:MAG: hypothetical protein ACXWGY_04720, partial [Chthoniobacterales bacterium]
MPTRAHDKSEIALEIGHVLLIDIVGYSKLLINEQTEAMKTLNEVVRSSACFRNADAVGQLIRLPTGDGMALVFHEHVEAPAACAMQIAAELKRFPEIRVRMGIHSGAINQILDVNDNSNVAGAGIDMAQRVMDCGDAGHILLSKRVADDLAPYPQWQERLHDLGEVKVKHEVKLGIVNLYTDEVGNPACPNKVLRERQQTKSSRRLLLGALAVLVALVALAVWLLWPNETPEKSIAVLPFENLSDDQANGYFVRGVEDEIVNRLMKFSDLKKVSAPTSTRFSQAERDDIPAMAKALKVAHILIGRVQKSGDSVLINVRLVRARTQLPIWGESYPRKFVDILAVEREVATKIAERLHVKLTGREQQDLELKVTDNLQAYDAYLRGGNFEGHAGFSMESLQAKLKAYGDAVELDPQFAQAWARLASAHA